MSEVHGQQAPAINTAFLVIHAIQAQIDENYMRHFDGRYDEGAGIVKGPFEHCDCPSHHQHGPKGAAGCPVCNPPSRSPE